MWPDWAKNRHLGDFLRAWAIFFFKKGAQNFGSILGDFLKWSKILIFNVVKVFSAKKNQENSIFESSSGFFKSQIGCNFDPMNVFMKQNLVTSKALGQLLEAVQAWGRFFKHQSCNFIKRVRKSLASQIKKKIIIFTNMAKLLWTLFIKLQLWFLKDRPQLYSEFSTA